MLEPMAIRTLTVPANSQTISFFDTTKGLLETNTSAATAAAPGTLRGQFTGARLYGSFTPVAQQITVTFETMANPAGTAATAFVTDTSAPNAGSKVIASGDTWQWNWLIGNEDGRIRLTSAATKPDSIGFSATLVWDRSSGA